jgi:hypothetical protein
MSPMAEFERNYSSHSETEASLFERATSISSKRTLEAGDILDRGVSLHDRPVARFSLETSLLIRTEKAVKDMDSLLARSSALVPGRSTCFIVDPQYSFLRVLKSAGDLNQLIVAWQALSTRMALAQRSFIKYQNEFRATSIEEMPSSPGSTAPEVYSAFPKDGSPISDVNYLYENVPHMREVWPSNYEPGRVKVESAVKVPSHLAIAFPDRQAEERPYAFYYSEDGTRIIVPSSVRSSHGVGPSFTPPHPQSAGPSRRGRVSTRSESPAKNRKSERSPPVKGIAKDKAKEVPAPMDAAKVPIAASAGLLSPDTRFKKPEDLLVPSSPRDAMFATAVPGRGIPNPLKGMASSGQFTYPVPDVNESVSQAKGGTSLKRPTYRPSFSPVVDPQEEATFHEAYRASGRDAPPHLPNFPPAAAPLDEDQRPSGRQGHRSTNARGENSRMGQGAGAGGSGGPPDDEDGGRD